MIGGRVDETAVIDGVIERLAPRYEEAMAAATEARQSAESEAAQLREQLEAANAEIATLRESVETQRSDFEQRLARLERPLEEQRRDWLAAAPDKPQTPAGARPSAQRDTAGKSATDSVDFDAIAERTLKEMNSR